MSNETLNSAVNPSDPAIPPEATPAAEADPAEVLEQVEQQAALLPEAEVLKYPGFVEVLPANLETAEQSLSRPEVQTKLAERFGQDDVRGKLRKLRDAAVVLAYLCRRTKSDRTVKAELAERIERAKRVNTVLESLIGAAAAQGLISSSEAAGLPVLRGRSFEALGSRVIDSAMLLKGHADALADHFVIEEKSLDEAIVLGTSLRETYAKRRARFQKPRNAFSARRDRVYTWLVRGYDEVRRIGAFLYGDEADRFVPPLSSRKISRRKGEAAEAAKALVTASESIPVAAAGAPVISLSQASAGGPEKPNGGSGLHS